MLPHCCCMRRWWLPRCCIQVCAVEYSLQSYAHPDPFVNGRFPGWSQTFADDLHRNYTTQLAAFLKATPEQQRAQTAAIIADHVKSMKGMGDGVAGMGDGAAGLGDGKCMLRPQLRKLAVAVSAAAVRGPSLISQHLHVIVVGCCSMLLRCCWAW